MEETGKIDVKTELIRAGAPYVSRGVRRFRELSKIQIFKYYLILYFAIGYMVQGTLGLLPDLLTGFLGFGGTTVHIVIWLFWPIAVFAAVSQENAIFSLAIIVIFATFAAHLRQKVTEVEALNTALEQKLATYSLEPPPPPAVQREYLPPPAREHGPGYGSRPSEGARPYHPEEPHTRPRYDDEPRRQRYADEPPRRHFDEERPRPRYDEERPRQRYDERPRPHDSEEGESFDPV